MMDGSIAVAALALGVSAVSFFYKMGRDTKDTSPPSPDATDARLDEIAKSVTSINGKMDKVMEWQQTAAGLHAKYAEQIESLFHRDAEARSRMERIEQKLDDRSTELSVLRSILEKVG